MKNKKINSKETEANKKGFYTMLYAGLAVFITVGAIVSYNNYNVAKKAESNKEVAVATTEPEVREVGTNESKREEPTKKYVDPQEAKEEKVEVASKEADASKAKKATTEKSAEKKQTIVAQKEDVVTDLEPTKEEVKEEAKQEAKEEETTDVLSNNVSSKTTNVADEVTTYYVTTVDEVDVHQQALQELLNTKKEYEKFRDDSKMSWPLVGPIVMDFSPKHVIWDGTLQVYKTNDSISLGAPIGTQVKATAEGVVTKIYRNNEQGNIVEVDNGNGWVTTYGQLQDDVLVSVGDVVKIGDAVGSVAPATKMTALRGDHLNLKVYKNGEVVDPKLLLVQ